ncbi:MAG: ATP-binding protein, partial [Rhodospirillaceae bacterium]|nr:ATP-binding protein [Rhodospirillaceae bacterium]
ITLSLLRIVFFLPIAVAESFWGIPFEDVGRIFNKFERGDQSSRESGAGLGLALVKSLIELHGGEIHVESQVDKGATIECRLPFSAKQPANNGMLERGTA